MLKSSWDKFDIVIAKELGITIEEYIEKTKTFETEKVGEIVVAILDDNIVKAKKIFNTT